MVVLRRLVLLAGLLAAAPQSPQPPRTGMIAGQVVDASGAPVAEAIVRVTLTGAALTRDAAPPPGGRVMADGEGRFFVADLPAGDYYLEATKEGYARGTFAQRRPYGPDRYFTLGEGERRTDARLTMWKFAVIAGTVVDEAGEPAIGVGVRAVPSSIIGGRQAFGNLELISELVPAAVTDDRGMFRLTQLVPGTYVVVVPYTQTTLPAPLAGTVAQDVALRNDLFFGGITEVMPLGNPRMQQSGDAVLLTPTRVLVPPRLPDGRLQSYRTTYYPSATTASAATPITVASGDERTDLTIAMRPVPAVRISGRLVLPDGSAPPPTTIRLAGEGATGIVNRGLVSGSGPPVAGFDAATALSGTDGRFTLLDVPAGEYVLTHADPFLSRAIRLGRQAYWISQRVTVGTTDVTDLTVTMRPALRVEGRLEFNGSPNAPAASPMLARGGVTTFEAPFADMGPIGQFAAEGLGGTPPAFATVAGGGRYIMRPVETGGWFVQSITADGRDITDRAFDLESDMTSIVVSYTDRPSKIAGTVKDARGGVSAMVVAFPQDPARWTGYGSNPRLLRSVVSTPAGAYVIPHLPPGAYYLAAIDDASDDWRDPKRLELLARDAAQITVTTGTPVSRDLTLRTK